MRPHRGVIVLVFGILGLVACPFLGMAAWYMAEDDLEAMAKGRMDPAGRDLTKGGRILGIIASVYFILWIFLIILFLFGALANAH